MRVRRSASVIAKSAATFLTNDGEVNHPDFTSRITQLLIGSKNGADSLLQPNMVRTGMEKLLALCAIEASLNLSGLGK